MIPSELFDRNVSSELRRLQLCRVMDNSKAKIWRIGVDAVSGSERDFFATNNEIAINQIVSANPFNQKVYKIRSATTSFAIFCIAMQQRARTCDNARNLVGGSTAETPSL